MVVDQMAGDRTRGFSSTTEYFDYLIGQDLEQLEHQPNSVRGRDAARKTYRAFKVLRTLIPDLVHKDYDRTNFKLLCDDFGLANLLVKSREDLNVVGVVDLEWSYAGPAQMLASVPWWLMVGRPNDQEWDVGREGSSKLAERYLGYSAMFQRILAEEEAKTPGHESKELSRLMRWTEESGAMWFHMILSNGFNGIQTFPFSKLIEHIGREEWERREQEIDDAEVEAFVERKMSQLEEYDRKVAKLLADREAKASADAAAAETDGKDVSGEGAGDGGGGAVAGAGDADGDAGCGAGQGGTDGEATAEKAGNDTQ